MSVCKLHVTYRENICLYIYMDIYVYIKARSKVNVRLDPLQQRHIYIYKII